MSVDFKFEKIKAVEMGLELAMAARAERSSQAEQPPGVSPPLGCPTEGQLPSSQNKGWGHDTWSWAHKKNQSWRIEEKPFISQQVGTEV